MLFGEWLEFEVSNTGSGSVWLERLLWEQEAGGSSPPSPINANFDKFNKWRDAGAVERSCLLSN